MSKSPKPGRTGPGKPIRVSKPELAAAKALARFKPLKKHVKSFVHIGLNGKPLPPTSTKKGIMVYVWQSKRPKKGKGSRSPAPLKFRPIRQRGRASKLVPRRRSSFNITDTGKKAAIKKFYSKSRTHSRKLVTIRPTPSEKRDGINYNRFASRLARDLRSYVNSFRSRGSFLLDVSFTVRIPRAAPETHEITLSFSQSELQHLTSAQYESFIRKKVYAFIAEQLSRHEQVTAGSARHIRSLAHNQGELRSDWLDRRGEPWEKQDFQTVRLESMSYKITRVSK